jgi:hypothetical protein
VRFKKKNWNDALSQILANKDKILSLHETLDILCYFTERDFNFSYSDELLIYLRSFATALGKVQDENNTYYGCLIAWLLYVREQIYKLKLQSHPIREPF